MNAKQLMIFPSNFFRIKTDLLKNKVGTDGSCLFLIDLYRCACSYQASHCKGLTAEISLDPRELRGEFLSDMPPTF